MKVVSLVPSVSETLVAWGIAPAAVTRFCEQPGIPTVGGTKDPDIEAIVAIEPDLAVLDEEENRVVDHDALVARGVPVHVLAVRDVVDVGPQLGGLARTLGVAWTAPDLGLGCPLPDVARTAFVPIWRRPWMALGPGTYGASLLRMWGIEVTPADQGRYPEVALEALGPGLDLVIAPTEPYPFASKPRAVDELRALGAPVVVADGQDLFWWGARTAGAISRLGAMLDSVQ